MIRKSTDTERDLTVQTCLGDVSAREIREAIVSVYDGEPTRHQLWDLTGANLAAIQKESIREFAKLVADHGNSRPGGKTAIVSPVDLGFGLARMYGAMADITGQQVQVRVFRSLDEANAWIDAD